MQRANFSSLDLQTQSNSEYIFLICLRSSQGIGGHHNDAHYSGSTSNSGAMSFKWEHFSNSDFWCKKPHITGIFSFSLKIKVTKSSSLITLQSWNECISTWQSRSWNGWLPRRCSIFRQFSKCRLHVIQVIFYSLWKSINSEMSFERNIGLNSSKNEILNESLSQNSYAIFLRNRLSRYSWYFWIFKGLSPKKLAIDAQNRFPKYWSDTTRIPYLLVIVLGIRL